MTEKRIFSQSVSFVALAAAVSIPLVACGGGSSAAQNPQTAQGYPPPQGYPQQGYPQQYPPQQGYPQQYPQQQPGYPQQQPVAQQPGVMQPAPQTGAPTTTTGGQTPAPAGSAPSPLPGFPLDPSVLSGMLGAPPAAAAPAGAGGIGDLAGMAVKIAQAQYAPSPMAAEGNMSEDSLQAGQHKQVVLTLQGGKCYTIIAASPIGQITNLNITLLAPPFYNTSAGTDNMTGPTAVIGSGNNPLCPITPFPLQYKLDVAAVQGQGTFAMQLYSKNK